MSQNDSKKKYLTQQNQPSYEQSPVMGVMKVQGGTQSMGSSNN